MKPEALIELLNAVLQQALSRWQGVVPGIEAELYERVLRLAAQFEAKGDTIRANTQNLRRLRYMRQELEKALAATDYPAQTAKLITDFSTASQYIGQYFSSFVKAFDETQVVLGLVKEASISATLNSLQGAGINAMVLNPIEKILRDNITIGGKVTDLQRQLRGFIQSSSTIPSRLNSYVSQITTDALQQYSRTYLDTITREIGLQFYLYEGGVKITSRAFCTARAGKYYHRREVEQWAALTWSGKIPGTTSTTIFVYAGGYHCYHFLIPVAIEAVPKEVVAKARANGWL